MQSINPANGEKLQGFPRWDEATLERALAATAAATARWQATPFAERAKILRAAATELRANNDRYARLITLEMGKLLREAKGEIEKCALGCEFYAENAEAFLRDESIATDATKSYVAYQPLGTVLAIMPWNFPFWQVFRFAATALMAGNTAVLKHASNVPQCALAIEEIFHQAGLPKNVFRTLMITSKQVERVIADRRIHAVTLTGSDVAGRQVARAAGANLKKCVLELGGSDAFVVLDDADLGATAAGGCLGRMQNAGQSCIAAKRFIVVDAIADEFLARFKEVLEALRPGDPMKEETTLAPLARADLRDELHQQIQDSIAAGAQPLLGCKPLPGPGAYYAASILDQVRPGMRAYDEEFFGPVAIVLRARDEADALRVANDSRFGLGASVWTGDPKRGEKFARQVNAGSCFVNGIVKSDPRLPFGGVKDSGYGRELSVHGIREFVNIKTVWIK
jgi:succinate-semialdehyde dehydrogenase/glutarate-semialdehyde dehydrogenase